MSITTSEFPEAGVDIALDNDVEDKCCKFDIHGANPMLLDVDGVQVPCCKVEILGANPLPTVETLFSMALFEPLRVGFEQLPLHELVFCISCTFDS